MPMSDDERNAQAVIAANIKAEMIKRHLTPDDLADAIGGRSRAAVYNRLDCTTRISAVELKDIARKLRVSVDVLLYAPRDSNPEPADSDPTARDGTGRPAKTSELLVA